METLLRDVSAREYDQVRISGYQSFNHPISQCIIQFLTNIHLFGLKFIDFDSISADEKSMPKPLSGSSIGK